MLVSFCVKGETCGKLGCDVMKREGVWYGFGGSRLDGPYFLYPSYLATPKNLQGKTFTNTHTCSCKTHHTLKCRKKNIWITSSASQLFLPKKKKKNTRTPDTPSETSQAQRRAKATRCNWPSHPMQNRSGHLGRTYLGVFLGDSAWPPIHTREVQKRRTPWFICGITIGSSINQGYLSFWITFLSKAVSDFFYRYNYYVTCAWIRYDQISCRTSTGQFMITKQLLIVYCHMSSCLLFFLGKKKVASC